MRCAVTGASGFIGRSLVERLIRSGVRVRVMSRRKGHIRRIWPDPSVEVFEADLGTADPATLLKFCDKLDIIFNCAGEISNADKMHLINSNGTRRLCRAAAGRVERWIQLSSVGVYGPHRKGVVTEEADLAPRGLYETTKTIGDLYVLRTALEGGFFCTLVRPSNVFGPTMPNQSLFQLISAVARGWFFYIGDKKTTVNYIHVENVVEGLFTASQLRTTENKVYLLSDCCCLTNFIGMIAKRLGKKNHFPRLPEKPVRLLASFCDKLSRFPLTIARIDAMTGQVIYSNRRIERELGYRHPRSMVDGINEMVDVWQERRALHNGIPVD